MQPKRIYHRMKADIRRSIINGECRPGDRIRSMREFSTAYGISVKSARQCILELTAEGCLETRGACGTFVVANELMDTELTRGTILMIFGTMPENKYPSSQIQLGALGKFAALGIRQKIICLNGANEVQHLKEVKQALSEDDLIGVLVCRHHQYCLPELAAVPVVFCNNQIIPSHCSRAGQIQISSHELACKGVRHLLANGHRKIGIIAYPDAALPTTSPLVQGLQSALHEHGLQMDQALVFAGLKWDLGKEVMYSRIKTFLARNEMMTALYICDDFAFPLAVEALSALGRKVPEDISIVSYANHGNEPRWVKEVTRVAVDFWMIGTAAADMLLQLIQNPGMSGKSLSVQPQLTIGETVLNKVKHQIEVIS